MGEVSLSDVRPMTPSAADADDGGALSPSQVLPMRTPSPTDVLSREGRNLIRSEVSRSTGRTEGLQGAVNKFAITPARDLAAGVISAPDLLLEQLPAFLVNLYREKTGDERGPIEPTDIFPSFEEVSSEIEKLTGLRRTEAENSFGKIIQMGVTALMGGPQTPIRSSISGGLSETAGQVAEELGPREEMVARILGSLAPFGAGAAMNKFRKDPSATVRAELDALDDGQLAEVLDIMETGQRLGTPVTVAEAMAQVGGGKGSLRGQRAVEAGKPEGSVRQVQEQVDARGDIVAGPEGRVAGTQRQAVEQVVPPTTRSGSAIGTQAQGAAQAEIRRERNLTNAITRPMYQRVEAAGNVIPEARLAEIQSRHPSIESAINGVRTDPVRRGGIDNLPDNSPLVLDAARARLRGIADAAERAGDNNQAAIAGSAAEAIDDEISDVFAEYLTARQVQAARRQFRENPLAAGPVGKVADTPDLKAQYTKVFQDPLSSSPAEVRTLIGALIDQDVQLAEDFVNMYLTQTFNKVAKGGTVDTASRAGGRFVEKLMGETGAQENILAAIRALPDGERRAEAVNSLMRVLSAQSKRLPAGSQTAEKTADIAARSSGPVQAVVETVASPFAGVPLFLRDFRYNKNIQEMAGILLLPADQIEDIVALSSGLLEGAAVQSTIIPNVGQQ